MQIGKRLNETDTGRAMSIIYPRLRADLQGPGMICGVNTRWGMAGAGRRMGWHTMETRAVTSVFLRIRCDCQRRRYSRSPAIRVRSIILSVLRSFTILLFQNLSKKFVK